MHREFVKLFRIGQTVNYQTMGVVMTEQEDESELKDLRKLLQEKDAEIFALKQKLLFKFGAIQYDEVLNNTPSPDHNEGHV